VARHDARELAVFRHLQRRPELPRAVVAEADERDTELFRRRVRGAEARTECESRRAERQPADEVPARNRRGEGRKLESFHWGRRYPRISRTDHKCRTARIVKRAQDAAATPCPAMNSPAARQPA